MKVIIPVTISVALLGVLLLYRAILKKKRNLPVEHDITGDGIQRIDELCSENMMPWIENKIEEVSKQCSSVNFEVKILPPSAAITLSAKEPSLKGLNAQDLKEAYIILLKDTDKQEEICAKIIITSVIADEFVCLKQDKAFIIPISVE